MSKHTPGPWHYERRDDHRSAILSSESDVMYPFDPHDDRPDKPSHLQLRVASEADAYLLAASPEMFAACKELLAEVASGKVGLLNTHPDKQRDSVGMAMMREAIAKAEPVDEQKGTK